jgi:hypothetical protein
MLYRHILKWANLFETPISSDDLFKVNAWSWSLLKYFLGLWELFQFLKFFLLDIDVLWLSFLSIWIIIDQYKRFFWILFKYRWILTAIIFAIIIILSHF